MDKRNQIVVIWSEGFPYEISASNEKHKLIAKAITEAGYDVYLVSKRPYHDVKETYGVSEGIKFINFHKKEVQLSYLSFLNSTFKEFCFLKKLRSKYNRVYLIGNYSPFIIYFSYSIVCKLFNIKLVLSIMEWHISLYKNSGLVKKCNAFLFDKLAIHMSKGSIVISDMIFKNLSKSLNEEKIILIPALTDIHRIDQVIKEKIFPFKYILYCGALSYKEVITTIILGFNKLVELGFNNEIHLILVLQGSPDQLNSFNAGLENIKCKNRIHVFSKLDYSSLIQYYKNAEVLMVPLRDTIQDKARYPQKIAEYTACEKPIISNEIGQVGTDFKHNHDIFFATDYSSEAICDSLKEVLSNLDLYQKLAINARIKCENYFHYSNYTKELDGFLNRL